MAVRLPRLKISEVELCRKFLAEADTVGWTPYPETAGWDILMVRKSDGIQVGIQAKTSPNLKVVAQALPLSVRELVGPSYRGVLVPLWDDSLEFVAKRLRLFVLHGRRAYTDGGLTFKSCSLVQSMSPDAIFKWPALKRHPLPDYVPDVIAGSKSPIQLTPWKIKALRICARLHIRGHVTTKDFVEIGLDSKRWTVGYNKWLVPADDAKRGRKYGRGPKLVFDRQHPSVFVQVLESEKVVLSKSVNP